LIALHLTGDTSGSSGTQEVRVSGPVGFEFAVRSVTIIPFGGSVVGQFVQVLIGSGGDTSDASGLEGSPLFERGVSDAATPSQDTLAGLMVPGEAVTVPGCERLWPGSSVIKVVTSYVSPAAGLPAVSVLVGLGVPGVEVGGVPVPVPFPEPGGTPGGTPGGGTPGGGTPGGGTEPVPEVPALPWWATVVLFPLPPDEDRPKLKTGAGLWTPAVWSPVSRSLTGPELAAMRAEEYRWGVGHGYWYELFWSGSRYGARYGGKVETVGGAS
jgi:hypothetical protein